MEKKCAVGEEPRAVLRKTPSLHERLIQCKQRSFDKDYTVKRKIGEGSFGEVYEVVHNTLGLRRALKVVRNTQASPYPSK
jgi:serine/threonine protein kinase